MPLFSEPVNCARELGCTKYWGQPYNDAGAGGVLSAISDLGSSGSELGSRAWV